MPQYIVLQYYINWQWGDTMTGKKKKLESTKDNGQDIPSLQDVLQAMARNQQELSDRLSDIEESASKGDSSAAIVKLANMYFAPEDRYLPDLSWISPLAAEPLAEALTLNLMTTEDARKGKISLNTELIYTWLHFQRGVRGRLLGIGADAMREQVSADAAKGEGDMPEFEAGKE